MMELFTGEKQNFWSWDYSPQMPDYQWFWIIGYQIKGISLQLHLLLQTDICNDHFYILQCSVKQTYGKDCYEDRKLTTACTSM
jgi:hypothetical protein